MSAPVLSIPRSGPIATSPQGIVQNIADLLDHGFGISYELLIGQQDLTQAIKDDRAEQPLIARSLDLIQLCVCGVRARLEPVLLRRDEWDRRQTADTLAAIRHLEVARVESRASNGLVEALRGECRPAAQLARGRKSGARR